MYKWHLATGLRFYEGGQRQRQSRGAAVPWRDVTRTHFWVKLKYRLIIIGMKSSGATSNWGYQTNVHEWVENPRVFVYVTTRQHAIVYFSRQSEERRLLGSNLFLAPLSRLVSC